MGRVAEETEVEAVGEGPADRVRAPLCVDLDGTLIKSDLLLESFFLLVKKNPLFVFLAPLWLLRGKVALKREIAERVDVDAALLPYQDEVIAFLAEEKEAGRRLTLATASYRSLAEPVAAHLGLFDEVLATDEHENLKGSRKLKKLQERFSEGFAYIGDHAADVPVFTCAEGGCYLVAPPSRAGKLSRQLDKAGKSFTRVFHPAGRTPLRAVIKAMRPHQWAKNILIFVPLLLAHRVTDPKAVLQTLLAFASFSVLASSVYVLNDLLDVQADRQHHRKRTRPFAAGDLSLLSGVMLFPVLLAAGLALAALLPLEFLAVVSVYYAVTMAYSLVLKSLVLIDVLVLAGLYTVRILAGSAATDTPVSFWLFAFSMFVFLCLAFVKRTIELWSLRAEGREKTVGRGYQVSDVDQLQSLGSAAGYVSVLVLALYLNSADVVKLYSRPTLLWAMVPVLLYWISRVWLKASRGEMHDDPIVFALKDPASWVVGILACAIVLGAS